VKVSLCAIALVNEFFSNPNIFSSPLNLIVFLSSIVSLDLPVVKSGSNFIFDSEKFSISSWSKVKNFIVYLYFIIFICNIINCIIG